MLGFSNLFKKPQPKTPQDQHNDKLVADWATMQREMWFNRYIANPLRASHWDEQTIDKVATLDQVTISRLQWEDACLWADLEYERQDKLTAAIKAAYGETHKIMVDLLYIETLDQYGKALKQARQRTRSSLTAQMKKLKEQGIEKSLVLEVVNRVYGK